MSKVILSPEEKKAIMREQGRLRAAKFYANKENKERVLEVKKVKYYKTEAKNPRKIKEVIQTQPVEHIELDVEEMEEPRQIRRSSSQVKGIKLPNKEPEPRPALKMIPQSKPINPVSQSQPQPQIEQSTSSNETYQGSDKPALEEIRKRLHMISSIKPEKMITLMDHSKTTIRILNVKTFNQLVSIIQDKPKEVIKLVNNSTCLNGKDYKINSKKAYLQLIVFLITNLHIPIAKANHKLYLDEFSVFKHKSKKQTEANKSNEVPDLDDYINNVNTEYGEDSQQLLAVILFVQTFCRDDLQLKIVKTLKQTEKDLEKNYIIVPDDDSVDATVIINKYKTENKYGQLVRPIDDYASQLVRDFMDDRDRQYGELLFTQKSLSGYISKINAKLGVPTGNGAINLIRKMNTTKLYEKDFFTEYDELQLANLSSHSVDANQIYRRITAQKEAEEQPPAVAKTSPKAKVAVEKTAPKAKIAVANILPQSKYSFV
jgi:hypothetical protein